jgi:hypothetical protein
LSGLRRILVVLAFLACATPAQAAPRPLAYSQSGMGSALAGDLAIFTRGSGAYAVPTAGGPARRIFRVPPEAGVPRLAASATRAAIMVASGGPERERVRVFTGPPSGPWSELDGPAFALGLQVDGDRLYTLAVGSTIDSRSVTVHDPDPHTVPFPTGRDAQGAVFAGDLVAYATDRRFVVRDWRTGVQRTVAELPNLAASIDLRDDGRALVATDDGELFDVPPGGVPRRIARSAGKPRFAGDHIVFVRGPRGALRVIDPSGRVRAFGAPTKRLGDFTTDGTRVLWEANDCLLVAPVTDPTAAAPGPGPCPRSELLWVDRPNLRPARTIPVTLRCVSAPRTCRGTFRLRGKGLLTAPRRFAIPAGRARRFAVRLSERGYRTLSRLVASADGAPLTVQARIDGHQVRLGGPQTPIEP